MDLQTEIIDFDDAAMDDLFSEVPKGTPNADTLAGSKKAPKTKESTPAKQKQSVQPARTDIENVDLESFSEEDEDEDAPPAKPAKKAPAKPVAQEEAEDEDEDSDQESAEEEVEEPEEAAEEEEAEEETPDVKSVLKSTVDYLVQTGLWQDFEGREELDVDEDTYAKLVAQQDNLRVNGMFEELVDSTGPFGKAIIDYVKNGGSPDEIIDLFKEQKQVESIPLDTADGQKEMVKHYYSEVLGWKPEKIEKYISGLVLSNELENESKEVKDLFGNYYKKEADRLNKEQNEYVEKQREAEQAFETNIRTTIKDRKDLSSTEKKTVEDYLLNYDQRLPNGNLVNKFYVNFAKMQANPQDYVDLVMFVMDKQKFVNKVATQEKTKAAAEAFKFIKGNGAVDRTKGSRHDAGTKKREKQQVALDWGLPTK
jgi:hypothetical protein